MARLPKDDPRYNDIQHNAWNHHAEAAENCPPGTHNDRNQPPILSKASVMNENNVYVNPNTYGDIFNSMNPYNIQPDDAAATKEENLPFNSVPSMGGCQNLPYRVVNLRNGQFCKVFIDENNQQLIFPMTTGQYELFNNQGLCDIPLTTSHQSPIFNMNQEYSMRTSGMNVQQNNQNVFKQELNNPPQSNFLNEVLGNWEPNSSGTYSPFGQNYPLSRPDVPTLNILQNNPIENVMNQSLKTEISPKRNKNSPLADTSNKKRIVAEVKPMRPSYSDVLAKTTKNNIQNESGRKVKPQSTPENKAPIKGNTKSDKVSTHSKQNNEEPKSKTDKKQTNTISSGSESGDINNDDIDKHQKSNKKSRNKRNNMSRKWSSLDDVTNDEENSFQENESQFVFIENQAEKPTKKEKKNTENRSKNFNKSAMDDDFKLDDDDDEKPQFIFQENANDNRIKKKKEPRNHYKSSKPVQDKKKTNQTKWRRNKPGYLGLAQNYVEQWFDASWKAVAWFLYLLSDICRMSAHLTFDLCTSVFTQTYVSSQAVWRSTKDWLAKLKDNKYLMYIDKKFGHTRFGFWRKLKWFKKEAEIESSSDGTKLNANIPLPATGEEAMKRLLACKGKDPYSILGVSVTCTDEEIKRYYRRQAFLVHPDKNQQPGAEEAFKILQHAFDLIGEPERRAAYERRTLESRHVEAAWSELSQLLAQLHDKMEFAANTIRCTNCGRRHKRVLTDRPCYAARYCAQCKIRHSAKEGDIWAESSMFGLLVMYYACMDGAVYQITQWASCQKKNLKQLRPDSHVVQYRIVLGNKAPQADHRPQPQHDPNLEEFLNNLYSKSGAPPNNSATNPPDSSDSKKRRKKTK